MKGIASVLASKGRGGDTMLMHVAPEEVQYLTRLGGITENPDTGLPEALKFKDFLPYLGSAFLGPAFKAVGFSPTVSSILASTAGTMLGGGSLEKGIMSGLVSSSLGRLGTALSPEASKAAAADTGYRFGIFKKPAEGGPRFGERYAEAFRSPQFNPIEAAKSATEGGLDKFITEIQKPSVMIPFTTGAGELARMSAAEKYQEQMAEMQRQADERRRRVYARNPQVLPPSSPYYRPPGMKEGGLVERKQRGRFPLREDVSNVDTMLPSGENRLALTQQPSTADVERLISEQEIQRQLSAVIEQQRLEREAAAQAEAERMAREEFARQEAARRAEAELVAREQAAAREASRQAEEARLAREAEAARVAEEQARTRRQEEAARAEAQRVAAEQARLAEERQQEAARIQAQQAEAARLEGARVQAQQAEAARLAEMEAQEQAAIAETAAAQPSASDISSQLNQNAGAIDLGMPSDSFSQLEPPSNEVGQPSDSSGVPPEVMAMMAPYTSQARNDQERQDIERAIGNVLSFDASRGMTGGAPGAFENYPVRLQAATDNIKDQNDFIDQVRPLFEQGKYKEAFDLADKLGKDNLDINRERASLVGGMEFPEESQQIATRYINMLISDGTLRRVSPPMNADQMGSYYDAIPFDKIPLSEIRGTGSIFDPDAKAKNVAALAGGTGYPDFFKYAVTAKKDVNLLLPTLQILLAFAGVPAALGNTIAGSSLGTAIGLGNIGINSAASIALGSAVIGAAGSVAQGGDFEDALKSALIAGGLGYLTAPQTIRELTGYLQDAGVLSGDLAKGGIEVVTDAAGNSTVSVSAGGSGVSGGGVSAPVTQPSQPSGPSQEEIRIQAEREAAARAAEEAATAEAARQALEAQERARQEQEAREAAERSEQQRLEEIRVQAEREAAARAAEEAATAEAARQALEAQDRARLEQEAREAQEAAEARRMEEFRIQAEAEAAAKLAEEAAAAEALRQAVEAQDRARLEQEAKAAAEEAARVAEQQRLEEIRIQAEAEAAAAAAAAPPVSAPVDTAPVTEAPVETAAEIVTGRDQIVEGGGAAPVTTPVTGAEPVIDAGAETPIDEFTVETVRDQAQFEPIVTAPPVVLDQTPIDYGDPLDPNYRWQDDLKNLVEEAGSDYLKSQLLGGVLAELFGPEMPTFGPGAPRYQGTGGLGYIPEGQERRYISAEDDYQHGFLPEWMFFENLNPPAVIETSYPGTTPGGERGEVPGDGGGFDDTPVDQNATGGMIMTKPKVFSPRDYLEMVRGYQVGGLSELPVGEVDSGRNLMTDGNKDLIDLTRAVILGEVEERADEIIQKFIDLYGYEEFQNLRDQTLDQMAPGSLKTGLVRGQTGGMDDMVDGVIGSQERVAVSPGEFIVPADVVAALGDGNTEKGGKELEKMMERTRLQKYGSNKQPPPVNLDTVMPA
jgi:hypothetical protein